MRRSSLILRVGSGDEPVEGAAEEPEVASPNTLAGVQSTTTTPPKHTPWACRRTRFKLKYFYLEVEQLMEGAPGAGVGGCVFGGGGSDAAIVRVALTARPGMGELRVTPNRARL